MRKALAVAGFATLGVWGGGTGTFAAGMDDHKMVSDSCQKQMQMSAAQCGCVADQAMADLDSTERTYISLPALDFKRSSALAETMSPKQIAQIDAFMRKVPAECEATN
jgi:hypothetical protein